MSHLCTSSASLRFHKPIKEITHMSMKVQKKDVKISEALVKATTPVYTWMTNPITTGIHNIYVYHDKYAK